MASTLPTDLPRHVHDLEPWRHNHRFDTGNQRGETRTRWVLALTLVTMVGEVAAGWWSGSMALLADGWHMGTHALALGVAALAYALARGHADDARYAFGTWKIEVLGSFASAIVLLLVSLGIGVESALRLWRAEPLAAEPALVVAVVGLAVNLISAWMLHGADGHDAEGSHAQPEAPAHRHAHDHGHDGGHAHAQAHPHGHAHANAHAHGDDHHNHGTDLNLRGAYLHVLADALTSVLAIAALAAALWWGWWWLDPAVGILGALLIAHWAQRLLRDASDVLLDREMDHPLARTLRATLESDGDAQVADLHLWRVGRAQFAAVVCIVADAPLEPAAYRKRLAAEHALVHVSIEVNRCPRAGLKPG
jgi:cation diffusion facilitator family transporter